MEPLRVSARLAMPTRSAPRLGREVTVIGWGAFKIGRNEGVKYPTGYDLPTEEAAARLIHAVIDMGIGVIDTAPAYGLSEARLGAALGSRRDGIFLSSKVGEVFERGSSTYDFTERACAESLTRSLDELRTQRLDLVWVHSNGDDEAILREGGAVRALAHAKADGRVGAIGFSPKSQAGALAAIEQSDVDALMLEYHPRDASMAPAIAAAGAAGKAVFVKKPLASGHLPPHEAIPWILANPNVTCIVLGGLNAERLRVNAALTVSTRPS
jgi:aryl-alcohol dehydrogenase-like predicted oxidoreductase